MTEMGTVPMGVRHLSNRALLDSSMISASVRKTSIDKLTVKLSEDNYRDSLRNRKLRIIGYLHITFRKYVNFFSSLQIIVNGQLP